MSAKVTNDVPVGHGQTLSEEDVRALRERQKSLRIINLAQDDELKSDRMHKPYLGNRIITTKYTVYNFIFKNLYI